MPFKRIRWTSDACRCELWFKVDIALPAQDQVLLYEAITTDQVIKVRLNDVVGVKYYQWDPMAGRLEEIEVRRDKKDVRRSLPNTVTVEDFIRNDGGQYDPVKLTEARQITKILARERRCPLHSLLYGQDWLEAIWEESRRHEIAFSMAQDAHPSLQRQGYTWEYDKDLARVLRVRFPGLSLVAQQRVILGAAIDIRVGPGKVVIS